MLMTRDAGIAAEAARAGVDRLFVDLEVTGKAERQAGRNTIISAHTVDDVRQVRAAAPDVELMARIDPPSPTTAAEVDAVIAAGADCVMLPMFTNADEVGAFVDAVDGRVRTCLLLETAAAVVRARSIAAVPGVDEIHVGLNDLHISTGIEFMFELLGEGIVEYVRDAIRETNPAICFGFGGGARLSAPHPVTPADVLGEHVRLGSQMIILSRTFLDGAETLDELPEDYVLAAEIGALRDSVEDAVQRSPEEVEATRLRVQAAARELAGTLRARQRG